MITISRYMLLLLLWWCWTEKIYMTIGFQLRSRQLIRRSSRGSLVGTESSIASLFRYQSMTFATASTSSSNASDSHGDSQQNTQSSSSSSPSNPKKVHTLTVCMVPPPSEKHVWTQLSEMRAFLKDPGFYRWPPHCNLLYPFVQYTPKSPNHADIDTSTIEANDDTTHGNSLGIMVEKLRSATRKIEPFQVSLNAYGTFGGKNRGVLWLFPDSQPKESTVQEHETDEEDQTAGSSSPRTIVNPAPLLQLQSALEDAFPTCTDLSSKGGPFSPHMTLSHFESLEDALQAQYSAMERFSLDTLHFVLDRIYLLERRGDGGQFCRVAEIYLGVHHQTNNSKRVIATPDEDEQLPPWKIHSPAQPFPDMPTEEAAWVYEERMAMKERRNRKGRRRIRRHPSADDPS